MVSFNLCVGPLPRNNISIPLLSKCTDELISAPKLMIFFPKLASINKISERESNRMPQPYFYLSRSAFLVSFTDPNKQ